MAIYECGGFSFESLESSNNTSLDEILDFNLSQDTINLSQIGIDSITDLTITNDGSDTLIADSNSNFVFKMSGVHLLTEEHFMFGNN